MRADEVLVEAEPRREGGRRAALRCASRSSVCAPSPPRSAIEARARARGRRAATPVFEANGDSSGSCAHGCGRRKSTGVARGTRHGGNPRAGAGLRKPVGDRRTMSWILRHDVPRRAGRAAPWTRAIRRCLSIREQHPDDPTLQPVIDSMVGVLEAMRGASRAGPALPAKSVGLRRARLSTSSSQSFRMYAGWVELLAGDPARRSRAPTGYEALERMGEQSYLSTTAAFLARAVFSQARYDEAERLTRVSQEATSDYDLITQALWRGTRARVLARRSDVNAERLRPRIRRASSRTGLPEHAGGRARRPRGDDCDCSIDATGRARPAASDRRCTRQKEISSRRSGRRELRPRRHPVELYATRRDRKHRLGSLGVERKRRLRATTIRGQGSTSPARTRGPGHAEAHRGG